jgi:hypothetical protein
LINSSYQTFKKTWVFPKVFLYIAVVYDKIRFVGWETDTTRKGECMKTKKNQVKKIFKMPRFSDAFLASGSIERGTDCWTRLSKGENYFNSLVNQYNEDLSKLNFHETRLALTSKFYIPWLETLNAIKLFVNKIAINDSKKAEKLRQEQHEQYLSFIENKAKDMMRHLRFADDVQLVLDDSGNFKDDLRPAFGDSYRELEKAKELENSDVEELI